MARNETRAVEKTAPVNGKGSARSAQDARADLLLRAARNAEGGASCRSDPLGDAKAAPAVVAALRDHGAELSRRGLPLSYGQAALALAKEIEDHLQALPAAAVTARGRSQEAADLIADAAATAHAVRSAVLRISRDAEGRRTARAFGLGRPLSARQPEHVLRALTQILEGLAGNKALRADLGVLPEDIQTMEDLAADLRKLTGAGAAVADEQARLLEAQGALRAFFDLFAAKASLALAGDPDERARLLSLVPRADERRHLRQREARASG